jgi:hypothetical protein
MALPPDEEKPMAKKQEPPRETKSEFIRKTLGKNPYLEYHQINQKWTKTGHEGQISDALFYLVRCKMGIVSVRGVVPGFKAGARDQRGLPAQAHPPGHQAPDLAAHPGREL